MNVSALKLNQVILVIIFAQFIFTVAANLNVPLFAVFILQDIGEVVSNTIFNKTKDVKMDLTNGLALKDNTNKTLFSINKSGEASASAKISAPEITATQATVETLTVKNLIVELCLIKNKHCSVHEIFFFYLAL